MKTYLKVFIGLMVISCVSVIGCKKENKLSNLSEDLREEISAEDKSLVASTTWTAAYLDLAGADIEKIQVIAPANLRHPPEYEITVGDIEKISNCNYFVYAGFERMMKTLGDSIENVNMIKIRCDNSIGTVTSSAMTIAESLGTQKICEERVLNYVNKVYEYKNALEKKGLAGAKVLCNANQVYLAKELGLEIVETFGPNPVTSEQIKIASKNNYDFIIDNVHNPVAEPLAEVAPKAKYIIWRNFPERVEKDALLKVISENAEKLF